MTPEPVAGVRPQAVRQARNRPRPALCAPHPRQAQGRIRDGRRRGQARPQRGQAGLRPAKAEHFTTAQAVEAEPPGGAQPVVCGGPEERADLGLRPDVSFAGLVVGRLDINLKAKTLTVNQARVLVDCKVRVEPPKSRNGRRTLPFDAALVAALTRLRKQQTKESEAAGAAYQAGLTALDWYTAGDEYVIADEPGIPAHPEWYSDEFARLLKRAGLRKIRLHDSRHTTLSLMEKAGVPISVISKWAGHYDAAFTMRTYVHASDDDLMEGTKTLARIHKIA